MDYFGLIKKSYEITLKHKFIWILGFLATFGFGSFRGVEFMLSPTDSTFTRSEFVLASVAVGIIAVTFLILAVIGQAGTIIAFSKLEKGHKINFKESFEAGWLKTGRVLLLDIFVFLAVITSILIIVLPVIALIISQAYVFAAFCGALLFIACLFFWLVIGFIYPYALRMVVLENSEVLTTLRESLHLVRNNFWHVVVIYLLAYVVNMVYSLAMILALGIGCLILFIIGYGIWLASAFAAVFYGFLAIVALVVTIAVLFSAYSAFNSGIFTLTYQKLKNI